MSFVDEAKLPQKGATMQKPVQSDTPSAASREAKLTKLADSLVFELQQKTALLQDALAYEESRAIVRNPADPQYPMVARSLRTRLDNLQKTISTLRSAA
jgi:hypothetical protein